MPHTEGPQAGGDEVPQARSAAWIAYGLLLWASRVAWPREAAGPGLDASWEQALAVALAQGLQFGREIVFTFGPLGALDAGRFQPELWWPKVLLFEVLFKGLLAWRWTRALRGFPSPFGRGAFAVLLLALPMGSDAWYLASIVMLAASVLRTPPADARTAWLAAALLAAIASVKFPYFVAATFAALVVAVAHGLRAPRAGFASLAKFALALVLVWAACGQAPWNLPVYAWRSWSVASGYSEAQARIGPFREVVLALAWGACACVLVALSLADARERRLAWPRALVFLAASFLAFKAGFVDHGESIVSFFGFAAVAPCLLALPEPGFRRRAVLATCAALALLAVAGFGLRFGTVGLAAANSGAVLGENLGRTFDGLATLSSRREELTARRAELAAQLDLPRTRAAVATGTVDLVGHEQGLLFLNDLAWKPRPAFQSYITVAPSLVEANGRFLAGPEAPDFALVRFTTSDGRLPMMEDAAAWQALLAHYAPVLAEHDALLLRRDPVADAARRLRGEVVLERALRIGETLELEPLSGKALRVAFDVRYTPLGALRKLLFRAAPLRIELQTNDRVLESYRALPGMLSSGVLLRPFFLCTQDWCRLYTRGYDRRVARLRLLVAEEDRACFEPEVRLRVERCDELVPEVNRALERWLVFGSFAVQPAEVDDADVPLPLFVEGLDAAVLHAPFRLAFDLPADKSSFAARFGVAPDVALRATPIHVRAELVSPDGTRSTLFERTLDPQANAEDRAPQTLEIALPPRTERAPAARLELSGTAAPGPGAALGHVFWADVRLR